VNGKQVSSVGRVFDPALEHVAPYFRDPYRPFICLSGSGALRIDPNKQTTTDISTCTSLDTKGGNF